MRGFFCPHGHKKNKPARDDFVDYAKHVGFEYEIYTCKLIELLYSGGVCIDVGANVGLTTMVMSQFYEKVYSFEPVPSTFSLLQKNVKKNKLGNVQIFNVGLGAEEKETEIAFAPNNRSGGYVSDKAGAYIGCWSETVNISTGDSFQINPRSIKLVRKVMSYLS